MPDQLVKKVDKAVKGSANSKKGKDGKFSIVDLDDKAILITGETHARELLSA